MAEFDPGPIGAFATHWDNRPSYNSVKARFRMNWGPIYYRGAPRWLSAGDHHWAGPGRR